MGKILDSRYKNDGIETLKLSEQQIEVRDSIKSKLENGVYEFETVACECGAKEHDMEVIAEKDRYGLEVRTVICRKCGLLLTNPRINQQSYNLFYDSEYRKLYNNGTDSKSQFFEIQMEKGKLIYDYISKNYSIDQVNTVLEIGCGAGGILHVFKENGFKVKGIDLGSEYIEFGRKRGLDLNVFSSQQLLAQNEKFDLIILSHVLEHFLDLQTELNNIKKLLSNKGIIYIEVPGIKNLYSYQFDLLLYLQNAHTYHFSLNTLKQVMRWNGFTFLDGNEYIRSIFKVNNSKVDMLVIDYSLEIIGELKNTEKYYYKQKLLKEKYDLLCKWVKLSQNKRCLSEWFINHNIKSVAIYGMGEFGEMLFNDLLHSNIEVKYLFDKSRRGQYANVDIHNCEEDIPVVDAIVVTPFWVIEELEKMLNVRNNYRIVSLKDILEYYTNE